MKKRTPIALLLSILMLFSVVAPLNVQAQQPVKLWINGNYVQTDVAPFIENDRTLVPIRVISENLGFKVAWDETNKEIIISFCDDCEVAVFQIGRSTFDVDDSTVKMDVAPKIINDRTFVPIRVIAELFNYKVDWDHTNWTVVIGEGYTAPASTNTFQEAFVNRVIDGDTIEVSIQGQSYKVRLIGVNTPETKHPSKGVEYFGKEASAYTTSQLTGKTVYLQKDVSETDKYGRLLRYVWLARPTTDNPNEQEIGSMMFNSILVENGYANASAYVPDIRYKDFFRTRESIAKNSGYGLWGNGGTQPVAPLPVSPKPTPQPAPTPNTGTGGWQETKTPAANGKIIGNKNSGIYHVPGGASYHKVSAKNAIYFNTEAQAQAAGFRRAKR